ncbi:hypothetical protein CGP76_12185, partial [Neisseria gonorrhoeae]
MSRRQKCCFPAICRYSGNTRQRLIFDLRPKGWLRHSRAGGNPGLSARKLIGKTVSLDFTFR